MYCGDCSEATSEALDVLSKISGVYKYSYEVTPTGGRAITYDEESWKPSQEEKSKEKDEFVRQTDGRQSKTKRVKNYLKKCKNVLGTRSASLEVSSSSDTSGTSSWYIENKLKECEVNELEEIFEDAQDNPSLGDTSSSYQIANIIEVKGPSTGSSESGKTSKGEGKIKDVKDGGREDESIQTGSSVPDAASPNLKESQDKEDGEVDGSTAEENENEGTLEIEIPIKLIYTNNRNCLKTTTKFNHRVRLVCG